MCQVDELIKRLKKNKQRPLLFSKNTNETVKKFILREKKFIMKQIIELNVTHLNRRNCKYYIKFI